MVQKRLFRDQYDGDFRTSNRESNRFHTFKTAVTAVREHTLYAFLEPFIRNVVREETECAISKLFHSSSSTSVSEAGTSTSRGCSLQLIFANNLPSRIFTNSPLKAEDGSSLKIVLYDTNSKTIVESHPLSSAKIDIVVLSGLFAKDQEDWTEEEFNSKILCEREGRRPLLAGSQSVVLRDGVGEISDVSITDNSSWIPNKKFILGARISAKKSEKQRVKEARSHPVSVKDNRGEGYTKHYPPSLQDEVWRLEKIRKDGKFHERLTNHRILTVENFLVCYETNQLKLRLILGLGRLSEKIWRKIVDHAKTCKMDDHTIFKYSSGCNGALVQDQNRYDKQPVAKPALTYQQAGPSIPFNVGCQQLEPTVIHLQDHLQIQAPVTNTNITEVDGTHSFPDIQNTYTDESFTSTLEARYVTENSTFLHQTTYLFPPLGALEQGNYLLPSSSYAAEAAEHGVFSTFQDQSANILN